MSHDTYRAHLKTFLTEQAHAPLIQQACTAYARELIILANLDLTPAQAFLESHYCPTKRRPPRDPVCMLRTLLLMLLCGITSISTWVKTLRGSPLLAVMTGFATDDTPGIGTCYDFQDRLVNGPYQQPCAHTTRPADDLKHRHRRRLTDKTDDRQAYPPVYHSQSEALVAHLLAHVNDPRPPTLQTRMQDLFVMVGLLPSLHTDLFDHCDHLAISGDGSILETAASPHGKPTCDCSPAERKTCDHPRDYTSSTAQWTYAATHDTYVFGDRYYHLTMHLPGHDLPLLTILPGGNEADHTLSLKALDDLLKLSHDHKLGLNLETFIGDMHHDTAAHYAYLAHKGLAPVIPLRNNSTSPRLTQLADTPALRLDEDGRPRCRAGRSMRHHSFKKTTATHVFACPAKRYAHTGGHYHYVFHREQCPQHQDCAPDSSYGPFVYLKADTDPRLYPPIPRDTKRFKTLYQQRTTTERLNALHDRYHLDRRTRKAAYGLIYLTLATICEHAVVRFSVALEIARSLAALLAQTLTAIRAT
jgi:hypothetical protein